MTKTIKNFSPRLAGSGAVNVLIITLPLVLYEVGGSIRTIQSSSPKMSSTPLLDFPSIGRVNNVLTHEFRPPFRPFSPLLYFL